MLTQTQPSCWWWGTTSCQQPTTSATGPRFLPAARGTYLQSTREMCLSERHSSSSSRMCVMNHNWSATKQHLYPQSVVDKQPFSFVRGQDSTMLDIVWVSATRTQISVCKSPFPSAGTALSLFRVKTVQQRPLLPREVETRLPDCGVVH